MKKVSAFMLAAAGIFLYSSCKKQNATEATAPTDRETVTTEACGTKYLDLAVDPSGGGSYLYVVYNTPSNPPVSVNTINGSAGNNQIGSSSLATTVYKMTGISFDPATSTCYGVTGNGGSHPNSLITFSVGDPNVVTITPLFGITPAVIDISDIERNPWNGRYYAIDRANNRLVTIDVNTAQITYLPNTLGFSPAGLAMDCNGKIYLMRMNGSNGNVYVADPSSGSVILGPCAYPGVIAPGVVSRNSEMGLHYDCDCTFNLVTGNFSGTSTVLTDGLPTCLGGPTYTSIPGAIKPTVDFSRLN